MNILLQTLAILAGLWLIWNFFKSIIRVTLLNRHQRDPVSSFAAHAVWRIVRLFSARRRNRGDAANSMVWVWPITILALILTWFIVVMTGFALFNWAAKAEPTIFRAFVASGSALSTLGFATPSQPSGEVLAITEGGFGLFMVVYLFTFVPGFLTAVQQRDDPVSWLYARTANAPSGTALIEWLQRSGQMDSVAGIWGDWEKWFRDLQQSETLAPMLALVPSFRRGEHWINAAAALLDAAAMACSAMDVNQAAPQVCLQTGEKSLRCIHQALSQSPFAPSTATEPASPTRDEFERACRRLAAAGVPIKPDLDQAWQTFSGLRLKYERELAWLASALMANQTPWRADDARLVGRTVADP